MAAENEVVNESRPSAAAAEPYSIFDRRQKGLIVFIAATAATFSGFASNIYFPALATIADDLKVSVELINLTVTSYLIFQGLAPSLWGPLSDVRGRRVAYFLTFLVFLGACVGLAETKNYATLIVLRSLQSSGSASTIAVGSAVIGDITTREERGGYMGIFQAGYLRQWQRGEWQCQVIQPNRQIPLNLYQKLTTVKFNRQAQPPRAAKRAKLDVIGPIRILFSKQAVSLILFLAVYYAVWQMSITAMSVLFEQRYNLSETQIGLTFIANGVGSIIGTLVTGRILDAEYRRVKVKHEASSPGHELETGSTESPETQHDDPDFPLEKARLRLLPFLAFLQCASIVAFGWTTQYRVHIAVPIITTFFTGWTVVSIVSVVTTYLIDIFPEQKAASSASVNLARCLLAAGGTSIVTIIIDAVGVGWTFTIAIAAQVVAFAGVIIQWRYGGKWRVEADKARRQAEKENE
ncbi:hypothetical protein O1611_g4665 [Lasiodiplodia mahajangana]|uniref:Uncharacterized protein n=1 Tax=Lasiodiplodia mahajangana TaxID=1108764 RepID=A0ACC2JNZ0_9PEZI|nr:hypothetical protein O1611_g4665 [Lasiodiplodia mahajangana]